MSQKSKRGGKSKQKLQTTMLHRDIVELEGFGFVDKFFYQLWRSEVHACALPTLHCSPSPTLLTLQCSLSQSLVTLSYIFTALSLLHCLCSLCTAHCAVQRAPRLHRPKPPSACSSHRSCVAQTGTARFSEPHLMIPHTVLFNCGQPTKWFFTSKQVSPLSSVWPLLCCTYTASSAVSADDTTCSFLLSVSPAFKVIQRTFNHLLSESSSALSITCFQSTLCGSVLCNLSFRGVDEGQYRVSSGDRVDDGQFSVAPTHYGLRSLRPSENFKRRNERMQLLRQYSKNS